MILDKVNMPNDLKSLNMAELNKLSSEIRDCIIKKVNITGGHFGPNLGIVEATVALHYVFDCPKDKIVFDVSHQCYPHKILTGRKEGFLNPEKYNFYTGYTAPEESACDLFKVGHTSTSVSLAVGVAKARDLTGGKENVIALIGDGSLSGGEAYEGLNNAVELNSNIIIVVNDNDMSITENAGGLYKNLKLLRETKGTAELNFFKTLGFEYLYVDEGNNVEALIDAFKTVKDTNKPFVVHIRTVKGFGHKMAEKYKEIYHYISPGLADFSEEDFAAKAKNAPLDSETYDKITTDFILKKAKKDKRIVAISPATPGAYGFTKEFREMLGAQYVDVGIAEEHAVAYASALAKSGAKPVLAIMSSFVQRTYDQLSQDLCLNNSPATILIHWGAITGADATHLGAFDIPLISNIPNIVYLAPTCKEEYLKMFEWSLSQNNYPVAIRVPFGSLTYPVSSGIEDDTDYSLLNKFKLTKKGKDVAIIGAGSFYPLAQKTAALLQERTGIDGTLINPLFLTGLDKELLEALKKEHKVVVTLEDGVIDGGFGEKISRFYGNSDIKVLNFGAQKEFTDRIPPDVLYQKYHLTPELITEDILKVLNFVKF